MLNTMGHLNGALPTQSPQCFIESLPNELLSNIFSFLESPQPSASHLLDEPRFDLTESDNAPIKSASCVSRRWRQVITPLLFKHAQFAVKSTKALRSVVKTNIQPFYDFIAANKLQNIVKTFTLLVHTPKIAYSSQDDHGTRSFLKFWSTLFEMIDPLELLVVAPSEALGDLTSCIVHLQDAWAFDCPCQYLRLKRPKSAPRMDVATQSVSPPQKALEQLKGASIGSDGTSSGQVDCDTYQTTNFESSVSNSIPHIEQEMSSLSLNWDEHNRSTHPNLWEIRPWSGLLLNEGSFIRAYATYEFWLRQPPSILQDLLGDKKLAKKAFISPTIRNFSYIGMFPMSHHFNTITQDCPRVDQLYIQLVPRNEILQQASKMTQVEAEDLWMERNSCYALLMHELFTTSPVGNFRYLKIFESGDAADEDAWLLGVEFVKRNANGWAIASQGVFVKEFKDKKSGSAEGDAETSAFEGALVRFAFNGTMKLPVSPYLMYNGNVQVP